METSLLETSWMNNAKTCCALTFTSGWKLFIITNCYAWLNLHMQAEGIFRINAENSQEEYVRDQLNRGLVPEGIDVHSLAGLIKVYFLQDNCH